MGMDSSMPTLIPIIEVSSLFFQPNYLTTHPILVVDR
ncbi:hypothetical protein BFJ71_g9301 [Fusarium oxysporum]|nr:hypothetical protein BFJ71_g9301 [Fusarium oxysporum]